MSTETMVAICFAFVMVAWAIQLALIGWIVTQFREATNDAFDSVSKVAQLGFIHSAAKNPFEAIEATVALENELAATAASLEKEIAEAAHPTKPKGRLIGFRGPDGRIVKFMTLPPPEALVRSIPEDHLVYQ